jgi:hypothetical protein
MQNSELFERKKRESIQLKNQAKIFAEKLARKKAEEVFIDRVQPTTMFTDTKKRQFIDKITQQYEPIFYKDIINKIISQKIIEEQSKQLNDFYNKKNQKSVEVKKPVNDKKVTQTNEGQQEIAQAIIESSREVYDMLNTNKETDNNDIPSSILEDDENEQDERLVMSILNKK